MPLLQYLLRPCAPFHYGAGRDDDPADLDDLPRSDSLASAILSVWSHFHPNADIATLAADPPFALSSAIPALKIGDSFEPLLFVPPGLADSVLSQLDRNSNDASRDAKGLSPKSLRKVRFASVPALRELLVGKLPSNDALLVAADGRILHQDAPHLSSTNNREQKLEQQWEWSPHLWHRKEVARPRLLIDRDTGSAAEGILFRYAATAFRADLRLLIVADLRPSCDRSTFEAALRLLGYDGIGGGRSIGHGRFEIEKIIDGFEPPFGGDDAKARMLLSLTHPTRNEVQSGLLVSPPAVYTLIARGGWAEIDGAGRFRRAAVRMLTEGSIVSNLGHARCGDSVRVLSTSGDNRIPHHVYRSGCAVSIPIDVRDLPHH
jgi:CRISPR type III-A-associated RAMP protein Csm4